MRPMASKICTLTKAWPSGICTSMRPVVGLAPTSSSTRMRLPPRWLRRTSNASRRCRPPSHCGNCRQALFACARGSNKTFNFGWPAWFLLSSGSSSSRSSLGRGRRAKDAPPVRVPEIGGSHRKWEPDDPPSVTPWFALGDHVTPVAPMRGVAVGELSTFLVADGWWTPPPAPPCGVHRQNGSTSRGCCLHHQQNRFR